MEWSMYNDYGERKYLTLDEFEEFMNCASKENDDVKSFCYAVAISGCRISEALSLSSRSIDFSDGHLIVDTLKKRERRLFRAVPLPTWMLTLLDEQIQAGILLPQQLWPWSRMTGYRRICEVMTAAGIFGAHACPKGLRHSFAVRAIQSGAPLNLVQRWLGHADIKTTAIYTNVMGPEERAIASRMWSKYQPSKSNSSVLQAAF
ncbi:site-specific integrase [Sphingobium aquiterrae]|uniref:tyrosine-type recombinase/integrase n=1 Tax=Sphingobium aquiterrae TaxID=2038656 RepID=UPI003018FC9B